jgi:hypothetical protein
MIFSKSATKQKTILIILLFSFSFVPPFLKELFELSSYTQGFIIAVLISLIINRININLKNNGLFSKIFLSLVAINFIYFLTLITKIIFFNKGVDFLKFFLFLPLFLGLLFCSKELAKLLIISKKEIVLNTINIFIFVLILGGIAAIFGYSAYGPFSSRKPTFVYSEVSHYALGIGPFLCYSLVVNKSYFFKFAA